MNTRVQLGSLVQLSTESAKDPTAVGLTRSVGLEHIDSDDLRLRRWSDIGNGADFTRVFRSGDVLFGKRRSYQRKVALASFDGVCSGDILVVRSADTRLDGLYLAYLLASPLFIGHAISSSAGSLSPRIRPRDLERFEFDLPPLNEQLRVVKVMRAVDQEIKAAEAVQDNAQSAIAAFVREAYLTPQHGAPPVPLGSVVEVRDEVLRDQVAEEFDTKVGLEHLDTDDVVLRRWDNGSTGDGFTRVFRSGDVLFGKLRAYLRKVVVTEFNGVCAGDLLVLRPMPGKIDALLLAYILSNPLFIENASRFTVGSALPRVRAKDLLSLNCFLPPRVLASAELVTLRNMHEIKLGTHDVSASAKNLRSALLQELIG